MLVAAEGSGAPRPANGPAFAMGGMMGRAPADDLALAPHPRGSEPCFCPRCERGALMPSTTPIRARTERDLDAMMMPLQALAGEIRLLIHWANDDCKRTWDV